MRIVRLSEPPESRIGQRSASGADVGARLDDGVVDAAGVLLVAQLLRLVGLPGASASAVFQLRRSSFTVPSGATRRSRRS